MVLERLMGRWLDSAKKHLRESMVISYRIAVARAVRHLGARELASLSDADLKDAEQQMESRGCLKRRTPSSASRRTEARSTTTASPT